MRKLLLAIFGFWGMESKAALINLACLDQHEVFKIVDKIVVDICGRLKVY
jgi:hypothetical protein